MVSIGKSSNYKEILNSNTKYVYMYITFHVQMLSKTKITNQII